MPGPRGRRAGLPSGPGTLLAVAAAALLGLLAAPAAAPAQVPVTRLAERDLARIQDLALQDMEELIRPDGALLEPLERRRHYGLFHNYAEAAYGAAALFRADQTRDPRLARHGFRVIRYVLTKVLRHRPGRSGVFQRSFMAYAFGLAARSDFLRGQPGYDRLRSRWRSYVRTTSVIRLVRPTEEAYNKFWVDASAVVEIWRTGRRANLTGPPRSILGSQAETKRKLLELITVQERKNRLGRSEDFPDLPGGRGVVFSDAPEHPLAYNALDLGFLARTYQLGDADIRRRIRRTLLATATGVSRTMAPDGDLAWRGRSHEQGWALALAAHGMFVAAGATPDRELAAVLRGSAHRTLGRLLTHHVRADQERPLRSIPVLRRVFALDVGDRTTQEIDAGLDGYVGNTVYVALVAAVMAWIRELPPEELRAPVAPVPADRPGAVVQGQQLGVLGHLRAGDVWFAVGEQHSDRQLDARYDWWFTSTLVRRGGVWERLLPLAAKGHRPAGVWLRDRGGVLRPVTRGRLRIVRGPLPSFAHTARFPGGRLPPMESRFLALGDGVQWRARTRPRQGMRFTVYVPTERRRCPRRGDVAGDDRLRITSPQLRRVSYERRRLISAEEPDLRAMHVDLVASRRGRTVVSLQAQPAC